MDAKKKFVIPCEPMLRACHWPGYQDSRKGEPIGIGRLLSAEILDRINWEPFVDRMHSSLDYAMINKVMQAGGKIKLLEGEQLKSLSISCDMWPQKHVFEEHWSNKLPSTKLEPETIIKEFPEANEIFNDKKKEMV